ncbi:AI-2E family transporter [Polymorphobacter fuscus]|uniref:AI-2E family transporter n=1 Tax=Sandarakinorhabdus fusca TaxID=1439888 RepID=UPI001430CBDF|nr:AI-2E family transporter [Polymorphobacter fuscus]NJC08558.1 putative PurR-regulated permease PerM [Polymorphobacter fuscus]
MTRSASPVIIALLLVVAALFLTRSVMEPVAFALFIVALAAPFQTRLRRVMPAGLALLATIVVTLGVLGLLVLAIVWSIGEIGHWVILNVGRFQASYTALRIWLETHDIFVPGIFAQRFEIAWITGPLRAGAASLQTVIGFIMLAFVFIVLGLKETDQIPGRITRIQGPAASWDAVATGHLIIAKFRRYMAVRALASVLTGAATAGLAAFFGVELPLAWGVMAFAFNFLPFIGPLIVVVLMTIFAAAQFGAWQVPALVLVTVTAAQFVIGSYLEPILAGAALSMSPFVVLLAVFFWGLLWGIPGAFLGVPIVILLITVCDQLPGSRWVATLLSGKAGA